jgi:hypothetical protein
MVMERAARPYIAAAAMLAAAGLIAATPTLTPSLPDVQVPRIGLTSDTMNAPGDAGIFQSLLHWFEGDQNQSSIQIPDAPNDDFFTGQGGLLSELPSGLGDEQELAESVQQLLLAGENLLLDTDQGSFSSALGAGESIDAPALNASGFVPSGAGAAGAVASQDAVVTSDVSTIVGSAAAVNAIAQLQSDIEAFQNALLAAEQSFNATLVNHELALEQATFGNDNVLNGVVNQGFDALNSALGAQEQILNNLLGITSPEDFTQALLSVGGSDDTSGGILGEIAGLQSSDFQNLFADFKGDLFVAALQNFFNFDTFGTDLTPLFSDAENIIDAFFGTT